MGGAPADDYYALLGVARNASADELRSAWRRLARRWHPDHAGASAAAIFRRLLAAYRVLSDPIERAKYDREAGATARTGRTAPAVSLLRVSGPLRSLLSCGIAQYAEAGVIELILTADEIAQGGMVTIPMRLPVHCPACATERTAPCARCGTTRIVFDLFTAWLAVPPGAADGDVLVPSALLPNMIRPVAFRIRVA
jgi:hypothetical protein